MVLFQLRGCSAAAVARALLWMVPERTGVHRRCVSLTCVRWVWVAPGAPSAAMSAALPEPTVPAAPAYGLVCVPVCAPASRLTMPAVTPVRAELVWA